MDLIRDLAGSGDAIEASWRSFSALTSMVMLSKTVDGRHYVSTSAGFTIAVICTVPLAAVQHGSPDHIAKAIASAVAVRNAKQLGSLPSSGAAVADGAAAAPPSAIAGGAAAAAWAACRRCSKSAVRLMVHLSIGKKPLWMRANSSRNISSSPS